MLSDDEPEFVVWGFGGMGSVSANVGHSMYAESWSQSNPSSRATSVTGSGESMHSFGGSSGYITGSGSKKGEKKNGNESGMAWVKRRRE